MATSFGAEAISLAITHARNELGYRELRPKQELAVKTFLSGNDVCFCAYWQQQNPLLLFAAEGLLLSSSHHRRSVLYSHHCQSTDCFDARSSEGNERAHS